MSGDEVPSKGGNPKGEAIRRARRTLTSVCHDLNNPLSIIAGNAQLLREIATSMNLGDEFVEPLKDIERAVDQVSEQLKRLSGLNDRLLAVSNDDGSTM